MLAGSIGSAVITSIFFANVRTGAPQAVIVCLVVVAVVTAGCCGLVGLLPRRAKPRDELDPGRDAPAAAVVV